MNTIKQFSVTIPAGDTKNDNINLDIKIAGETPIVRSIICLNDMSSLVGKTKMTLKHNSLGIDFLDEIDVFGISKSFNEKHRIDYPGAIYDYKIENSDTSPITLYFQVELEYRARG